MKGAINHDKIFTEDSKVTTGGVGCSGHASLINADHSAPYKPLSVICAHSRGNFKNTCLLEQLTNAALVKYGVKAIQHFSGDIPVSPGIWILCELTFFGLSGKCYHDITFQYPPFVFPTLSIYPFFLKKEILLSIAVTLIPNLSASSGLVTYGF